MKSKTFQHQTGLRRPPSHSHQNDALHAFRGPPTVFYNSGGLSHLTECLTLDTTWGRGSNFGNSPINFILDHLSSALPVRIIPHAEDAFPICQDKQVGSTTGDLQHPHLLRSVQRQWHRRGLQTILLSPHFIFQAPVKSELNIFVEPHTPKLS